MGIMLVPLVCFVHLLRLLMKLNTIKKIQLFSLSRTFAEEKARCFSLDQYEMESSLVNGKKTISSLYLFSMYTTIHILPYSHLYIHFEFHQHLVLVWFCLNNSSTVWYDFTHLQAGATPFSKNTRTNGITVRRAKKTLCYTEPFQVRRK